MGTAQASDFLENMIVDWIFRTRTPAKPAALYLALFTGAPSDAGGGTEVTGGSYGRVNLAPLDTNWLGGLGHGHALRDLRCDHGGQHADLGCTDGPAHDPQWRPSARVRGRPTRDHGRIGASMAAMTTADRLAVGAQFQSDASAAREPFGAMTKADLQAAVAAIDDWVVANAAAFNTAIPATPRAALTSAQKARLLSYVVQKRYLTGA
jgi:hypothetical protein